MNNAQFMKVINMALIEYDRECKNCDGYIYMCIVVESLHYSGQISQWQCKRTRGKINKLINGYGTLATFLTEEHGVKKGHRFDAAYYFWQTLVNYYYCFGDILPAHLIVQQMEINYPYLFKDQDEVLQYDTIT